MVKFLPLIFILQIFAQEPPPPPDALEEAAVVESPAAPAAAANSPGASSNLPAGRSLVQEYAKPFMYERDGQRDPFVLPEGLNPLVPGPYFGPFLELQEVKLDNVKLKGVFLDPSRPRVLLQVRMRDKDSLVRLGKNDYIGENFGYIAAIRENEIVIVQTFDQGNKKYSTTRTISIEK
ncbi:MAG: pilus assembly protein PilP [Bdellovibrionales bacterium]|nr:pilus assembly protein PilP [Bdellovibrionales bacterium]